MRLAGKTVVVTAAGQGIGRASVLALAREGAQVWATDLRKADFEAEGLAGDVRTAVLDVSKRDQIDKFFAGLPKVDVLFNCAGVVHNGSILEATDEDWDTAFAVNVRSQFWTIKAALPGMLAAGGGSIINMASVAGSLRGLPNRFVYSASKAAIVGLTKSVAADFVGRGIRCNSIAPGTVDTPSLRGRIESSADPVVARKNFIARQPMGRFATAEEVASMVVYLASDESAFITGQNYAMDGGMTL